MDNAPANDVQAEPRKISAENPKLCHLLAKENPQTSVPLVTMKDGAIRESVIVRHGC